MRTRFWLTTLSLALALSAVAAHAQSSLSLDFSSAVPGTIMDGWGNGTGLTDRLPGTGSNILPDDNKLLLNTGSGVLRVYSTRSDINTQGNLPNAEYLGTSLANLGFSGDGNDFTVQAVFRDIQYSESFDQFGLYVGTDSEHVFRGGWLVFFGTPTVFTTNHDGTLDFDGSYDDSLAPTVGDTLMLTLKRTSGQYSYSITNLSDPTKSGDIPVIQPTYLAGASNLYVGVYASNASNGNRKRMVVTNYGIKVQ